MLVSAFAVERSGCAHNALKSIAGRRFSEVLNLFGQSGAILLIQDSGSGYVGSASLGTPGTLQNSQCILDTEASTTSKSGNNLTVNLAISFKAGFTGTKNIYMSARDKASQNSGWQNRGGWNIPSLQSISVTPSTVLGGSGSTGTVTLGSQAGAGGVTVALLSDSTAANVPATVTVPAGATTANFAISTTAVSSSTAATITATLTGVNRTATLTVTAPTVQSLVLNPNNVARRRSQVRSL
jgi:hypothetical protein